MSASEDPIYTHTDGHPYYSVEVQQGDTLSEMGAKKGYSYRESMKIYYSAINASAPNAVRSGSNVKDTAINPGQIFYIPLRRAWIGQTVTHMISLPKYSVKCVYEDDPSEPVKNGFVLFWEYDQDGTKLNTHKNKPWKMPMSDFPVGYARTDGEGILAAASDIKGAQFNNDTFSFSIKPQRGTFLRPKHNPKNHSYYLGPLKGEPKIISPKKLYCSDQKFQFSWAREYTWADDISRFPGNNDMAFMAVPANVFKELETVNVNELGKNDTYVWKGKLQEFSKKETERTLLKTNPDKKWHHYMKPAPVGNISFKEYQDGNAVELVKNQCIVKIACSLPEWIRRIRQQTEKLDKTFKMYEHSLKHHIEALLIIDRLQTVSELRAKFPYTVANKSQTIPNKEIVTNWLLVEKLDELKEKIIQTHLGSNDQKNKTIHKKYKILEEHGKKLKDLLNKKELLQEIKDYLGFGEGGKERTLVFRDEINENQHKPEMLKILCDTLLNAYTALSKTGVVKENLIKINSEWETTLADEVFDNDIEVMFDQLRSNIDSTYIKPEETPLSVIISAKTSAAAKWVANSPGPPSLGVGLIDAFGTVLSRKIMSTNKMKIKNDKYFKVLLGAIALFRKKYDVRKLTKSLTNRIETGELNRTDTSLAKLLFTTDDKKKLAKVFGRTFKGIMFMTSLLALKANMDENEDPRLICVRWFKIVESTTGVVISGVGLLANIERLVKYRWATKLNMLAKSPKLGILGVVASVCSIVISYKMAEIALKEGDMSEAVFHGLSVASAIVICIGTLIGIFGSLFWGLAVTSIGVVFDVSLTISKALIPNANILEDMSNQFKKIQAFKIYTNNAGEVLDTFYTAMEMLNSLPTRKLSWRGVIPMYLNGFGVYEKAQSTKGISNSRGEFEILTEQMSRKIDYGKTEDLLAKYVEAPENPTFPNYDAIPIMEALKIYESTQKDEKSMFIDDHIDDGLKWREGSIFPELYPIKRTPVYVEKSAKIKDENHTLQMNVNDIVFFDTEGHGTESWLSYKRKVRNVKGAKMRIFPWSPQEFENN